MHISRKVLKSAISQLHPYFPILERKEPFALYEIHDAFGVMLANGKFVFHSEQTDEDIKNLPNKQENEQSYRATAFLHDIKGREVKDHLLIYLGELEYICAGVNGEIFDEETIRSMMSRTIVRAYLLFESYIEHLRSSYPSGEKIYWELERTAKAIQASKAEAS